MKIVALKYGESVFGENYILKGGRKDVLLPISFTIYLIDDTFSLTENVMIKKIGGHSIGSCIVLADNYVLCGDECY
ncbi:MAG: hypothetical protein U0L92_02335 [Clostridia bacterium]|nr:hypothetical protein [Clostridia bacterium]